MGQVHVLLFSGKILHCALMGLAFYLGTGNSRKCVVMYMFRSFLWDVACPLTVFIIDIVTMKMENGNINFDVQMVHK